MTNEKTSLLFHRHFLWSHRVASRMLTTVKGGCSCNLFLLCWMNSHFHTYLHCYETNRVLKSCNPMTQNVGAPVRQLRERSWVQVSSALSVVACDSYLSAGDAEAGGSLGAWWQSSPVESVSFRLRERSYLKKSKQQRAEEDNVDFGFHKLWHTHMNAWIHLHTTHIHTQIKKYVILQDSSLSCLIIVWLKNKQTKKRNWKTNRTVFGMSSNGVTVWCPVTLPPLMDSTDTDLGLRGRVA